jgi:hypothetical protein
MILVPKERLSELEDGFLRLWFAVNKVATRIDRGSDLQPLSPVLRLEMKAALEAFFEWRLAKWWQVGRRGS